MLKTLPLICWHFEEASRRRSCVACCCSVPATVDLIRCSVLLFEKCHLVQITQNNNKLFWRDFLVAEDSPTITLLSLARNRLIRKARRVILQIIVCLFVCFWRFIQICCETKYLATSWRRCSGILFIKIVPSITSLNARVGTNPVDFGCRCSLLYIMCRENNDFVFSYVIISRSVNWKGD